MIVGQPPRVRSAAAGGRAPLAASRRRTAHAGPAAKGVARVRPIRRSDGVAYRVLASDPVTARLRGTPHPFRADDERSAVRRAVRGWREKRFFTFAIELHRRVRGFSQLYWIDGRLSVGYWIGRKFWGRGFARRIVRRTLAFAFDRLKASEVFASAMRRNLRSRRVLQRLGFVVRPTASRAPPIEDGSGASVIDFSILHPDTARSFVVRELQAILDGYSKIYDVPPISLDGNGMTRLRFRDEAYVDVEISARVGHFHLYTVLTRVPPYASASWFRSLLEANLFNGDTGYATTACDPETDEVLLCQLVDVADLTPERFDVLVQNFVASSETLTRRLRAFQPRPDLATADAETQYMIRA